MSYDGPRLVDWIEHEAKAAGYRSLHEWCQRTGVSQRNLTAYKAGVLPGLEKLQQFADALDRTLLDVLVAACIVPRSDLGPSPAAAGERTRVMSPQEAIRASDRLLPSDKAHIIELVDRLESSGGGPVRVQTGRRK